MPRLIITTPDAPSCEIILRAGGADLDGVTGMNEAYARWSPTDPPTRHAAQLGADVPGLLVSIRMTAYVA